MTQDNLNHNAEQVAHLTFQLLVYCQLKESSMSAEFNMAPSELRVLRLFTGQPVLRQRELHDRLGLSGSRLTRLIDVLVNGGFVTREEDPEDRRGALLRLTAEGILLVDRVERRSVELHVEILRLVPVERHGAVVTGLQDMLDSITAWSAMQRRPVTVRPRTLEEQTT